MLKIKTRIKFWKLIPICVYVCIIISKSFLFVCCYCQKMFCKKTFFACLPCNISFFLKIFKIFFKKNVIQQLVSIINEQVFLWTNIQTNKHLHRQLEWKKEYIFLVGCRLYHMIFLFLFPLSNLMFDKQTNTICLAFGSFGLFCFFLSFSWLIHLI